MGKVNKQAVLRDIQTAIKEYPSEIADFLYTLISEVGTA